MCCEMASVMQCTYLHITPHCCVDIIIDFFLWRERDDEFFLGTFLRIAVEMRWVN